MEEQHENNGPQPGEKRQPGEEGKCSGQHGCHGCPNGNPEEEDADSDVEGVSRSRFIRTAFAGTVLAWGGVALAPVVAYLIPPAGEENETSTITSVEVCKLSDLPKGAGRNFRFGSVPALVIHTDDGELHAFKAICTHLGCTVQFRADKQCIYCACHGGEYDAETGKNVAGPPPKPLPPLKVAVVEGKVIVSKA
jgi:Rieske Fe-S protein